MQMFQYVEGLVLKRVEIHVEIQDMEIILGKYIILYIDIIVQPLLEETNIEL